MSKSQVTTTISLYICRRPQVTQSSGRLYSSFALQHPWLTDEETARIKRFKFEKDQQLSLLSKLLMRWSLSQHCGISPEKLSFSKGKHGKPYLDEGELLFNLSHTEDIVVLALGSTNELSKLGVDVEGINPKRGSYKLANRFFSTMETEQVLRQTPWEPSGVERFNQYWTLKESFIKAMGTGLSMPLSKFGFDLDTPGKIAFTCDNEIEIGEEPWSYHLYSHDSHFRIALGYQTAENNITVKPSLAIPYLEETGMMTFEQKPTEITELRTS